MSEDSPWEDLKHSDYRALLDEAKSQLRSINAQIEGIQRISNVILIKKSQSEFYTVSDDLPLEMSVALSYIRSRLGAPTEMDLGRTIRQLERARASILYNLPKTRS